MKILKFSMVVLAFGLIFFEIFFSSNISFTRSSIFIGILESFDPKTQSEAGLQKSPNPRARTAFFKEGGNWQAMESNVYTERQLNQSILQH